MGITLQTRTLTDKIQRQRFEQKYIVPEGVALAVRDFVCSYLAIDEFGATRPNLSYPVHSLYLDSPALRLYQTTINGEKNRYKLRVRFYENRPGAPVFLEVKRRMNNTISKERGGVCREALDSLLAGHPPEPGQMVAAGPIQITAIQNFIQHMKELNATPKVHVAYLREAWISTRDNSVRVTLDRQIRCEPEPTAFLSTTMGNPRYVFGNKVVLELKFTNRFPDWFCELVRVFSLVQCGAAKYADGVTLMGEDRVRNTIATSNQANPTLALWQTEATPSPLQKVSVAKQT